MIATAPGKLILTGEYAVLDGAPALVLAVNRRVVARSVRADGDAPPPASPFLAAVADELAARGLDPAPARAIAVDSDALYLGAQKLGLGSSAAVTVAATALALGAPLDRARVFAVAAAAHARAQGERGARGSGADVASAVYGGAIAFTMGAPPRPLAWPTSIRLVPFFTGASADTAPLVAAVTAARILRPAAVGAALTAITAASRAACAGCALPVPAAGAALIAALTDAGRATDELAAAAGIPLVPACVSAVRAALAGRGAVKTTGAGGGDVAIAVISNTPESVTFAERSIIEAGGAPLALALDPAGVDLAPAPQ